MAAYASSVTLASQGAHRWRGSPFGAIFGVVDITNYNSTTTEETTITDKFKAMTISSTAYKCFLMPQGTTDNGYSLEWNPVTGKFKAWKEASAGAKTEASDDTDVGAAEFVALGVTRA